MSDWQEALDTAQECAENYEELQHVAHSGWEGARVDVERESVAALYTAIATLRSTIEELTAENERLNDEVEYWQHEADGATNDE